MSLNQNRKNKGGHIFACTFLPACGILMFCHVRVQPGMRVMKNKTSEYLSYSLLPVFPFFFKRKRFLCALFLHTFVLKSHCLSICKLTDVCVGHKVSQAITFHIKTDFNCFPVTFANILQWKSCKKCANIKVSSSFRLANKNKALCTIGRVWQRVTQTHYCTYSQKLVVVRMWTWLCLLLLILKYFSRCNTFINSAETLAF